MEVSALHRHYHYVQVIKMKGYDTAVAPHCDKVKRNNLFLCLTKYHYMKTYGGEEV